jgi:cell division protein FtsB
MSNKTQEAIAKRLDAEQKKNAELQARITELETALNKIAYHPDCNISGSDYRIGVADGCRMLAQIARDVLPTA